MQTQIIAPTRPNGIAQTPTGETVCMVYKTHKYDVFKIMDDNRTLNLLHVKRLVQSFRDQYLVCPIIVNEKFQVIDGQHRLKACTELGIPVYYIIMPGYGIHEVQILNTNQKNWNQMDFLKMYCEQGRQEYIEVKKFMDEFQDFGIAATLSLIKLQSSNKTQGTLGGKKVHMKDFEEGKLKIPNITKSYIYARKIMDFQPYYKEYYRGAFVSAVIPLFSNKVYNHKEMLHKLENCPDEIKIKDAKKIVGYRLQLEEIYNYKRQRENKVSFRYV